MKRLILTCCTVAFLVAACNNDKTEGETSSKDSADKAQKMEGNTEKKEEKWIPITMADGMAAMMKNGELRDPHKMLAKSNGTWNAEVVYWMGIDSPAIKSKGISVNSMILNGHFQQSKFSGDMMGMPFEGLATVGYDNTTEEYVSTWIENGSTSMMIMRGKWDDASKSLVLTGTQKNPANGQVCKMKETLKFPDDNTQVMEMYGPDGMTGKEYKWMQITYTKKK